MSARAKAIAGSLNPHRWMAEITYEGGGKRLVRFEEVEELDEIVEQGPDWNTIDEIVIRLNRPSCPPKNERELNR